MIKPQMQLLHINVMAHFQPSRRPTAGLECSVGELRLLRHYNDSVKILCTASSCTRRMFVEWQTLGHNQTSKISLLKGLFEAKYCSLKTKH